MREDVDAGDAAHVGDLREPAPRHARQPEAQVKRAPVDRHHAPSAESLVDVERAGVPGAIRMASVTDNVMKFFRGSSGQASVPASPQKRTRRSSGMAEISRLLNTQEGLYVLDLGSTSANNIRFLTAKGHKNYSEDLLRASLDPDLRRTPSPGR